MLPHCGYPPPEISPRKWAAGRVEWAAWASLRFDDYSSALRSSRSDSCRGRYLRLGHGTWLTLACRWSEPGSAICLRSLPWDRSTVAARIAPSPPAHLSPRRVTCDPRGERRERDGAGAMPDPSRLSLAVALGRGRTVFAPFFIRLSTVFHRYYRFLRNGREDEPRAARWSAAPG